jgi:hypothetical protein
MGGQARSDLGHWRGLRSIQERPWELDGPFCTRISPALVFGFFAAAASSFFFMLRICATDQSSSCIELGSRDGRKSRGHDGVRVDSRDRGYGVAGQGSEILLVRKEFVEDDGCEFDKCGLCQPSSCRNHPYKLCVARSASSAILNGLRGDEEDCGGSGRRGRSWHQLQVESAPAHITTIWGCLFRCPRDH